MRDIYALFDKEQIALQEFAAWSDGGPLDALMAFQERLPYVYL
jgi:hypothetical protein